MTRRRPILSRGSGGVSGPAIKPLALQAVWQLAGELSIPVIGIGGITSVSDALEFLLAGAVAVQLGTVRLLGTFLSDPLDVPGEAVAYVAEQLRIADPSCFARYSERLPTWLMLRR